ncbi:N-acetylmuramoyl-L-alanine amidase [Limosilactobacillus equigenerosi]|uniref:N-acetylmuramoyl-L-alanine amidase n=1 Tax=Limosilactobacillus equigenerosi TaxID=417373 RepID=UPI000704EE83|nr:N-acetylmuramoyl-L-alanine amidase [Limosilactobacillus equigenerosi]
MKVKLYKKGKLWVTTMLGVAVATLALGTISVSADETGQQPSTTQVTSLAPTATNQSANRQQVANDSQANWKQENGGYTYVGNDQSVKQGRHYAKLATINGTGENWYLVDNGRAQNQIQSWAGSFWYFDPNTYLLSQKRQLVSEWGNQYVVGEDGRIQSGVQQVNGQIYDMDPSSYTYSNRRAYAQANNGSWYLVDHGKAQSGVQEWAGSYWYFNPTTYLLSQKKDYIKSQWGLYYLVGNDGRIQSGVQEWSGSYWYFDPTTYLLSQKRDYVKSQWGDWYLVGNDGRIQSGVQEWAGSYWYFDPATYLLSKKRDYIKSQWGDWYLVGNDGRIQSGLQEWAGSYWYFDPASYLLVKNKDFYINGVKYHADQDGRVKALNLVNIDTIKTYMINQAWGDERTANNKYIILHEVGVETGAAANAAYFYNQTKASVNNENVKGVYSTFVVGDGGKIYQVSQPGKVSWAAGGANIDAPVQIELGRTWNANQFWQDYKAYVNLARSYALAYGIPLTLDVGGKDTPGIKSHLWVTNNVWYGGGHTDPYGYLNRFGVTQAKLAHDLQFGL